MPLFGRRFSGVKPLEQMEKSKSSEGSSGFTVLSQEEVAARKARREALEAAERDRAGRRSFGFSFPGKSKNRISAYEEDSGSSNRGSNSSSTANSTNMNLYSTGSSARLSSSSTLPSSVGGEAVDDLYISRSSTYGVPAAPRPLTHRDRASTLGPTDTYPRSFPPKDMSVPPLPSVPPPPVPQHKWWGRSRTPTVSSTTSTARPPKLDLGLSSFGDFGEELFAVNGGGVNSERQDHAIAPKPPQPPPHTYTATALPPSPYSPKDVEPLLSPSSQNSRERSPATLSFPDPQAKVSTRRTSVAPSNPQPTPQPTTRSVVQPATPPVPQPLPQPAGQPTKQMTTQPPPVPRHAAPRTPANGSKSNHRKPTHSTDTTQRGAIPVPFKDDELDNEPLFPENSKPAFRTPEPPEVPAQDESPGRTVTAAEFAKMKKLADQEPEQNNEDDEYASDSDAEESDSEKARRDRWAREKQQGDLAVNRQIYRKTVGGMPEVQPNRFSSQGSAFAGSQRETESDRRQFEHDGDWDVPLGALAAHGFPKTASTSRPSLASNRPSGSASQIELRTSGQFATDPMIPRPASTVGSVSGQLPRASTYMPPFAKGLPADPHFGGVVPAHPREQLRFNGRSASNPAVPVMPPQNQQSATLMDVIVGEERARATRRGSPSAPGIQGQQHLMQQNTQHPYHMNQRNSIAPQHMSMGPNDFMALQQQQQFPGGSNAPEVQMLQQQLQFTQQMMVQMQQQMMQMSMQSSAASMVNGHVPQPMPQPGFLQPNLMQNQHLQLPSLMPRPMSMAANMNGMSGMPYQQQQRPVSTYTPSMYGGGRPAGYAPSIAPSERNTTGMSSRYRSVGNMNSDQRSVVGGPTISRPASSGNPIKAILKHASSQDKLRTRGSDDSDEEKFFVEANRRAKARRAKTEPNMKDVQDTYNVNF